jgi:hypothetical protein
VKGRAVAAGAVAFLGVAGRAAAQTGPALLVEPFPKEQLIHTSSGWLIEDAGHVQGSGQSARLSFYESSGRVRLFPGNLASPRVGWEMELIDVDLGSGPRILPGQLIDVSVGAAFPVAKVGEWIFGGAVGLGYAGGSPFGEGNSWYGKASALAFRQFSENDALVIILDYDANRTFLPDVPLPGLEYTKRVSPQLFYVVGLPVTSVTWKPMEKLSIEASYYPIESFHAALGYEVARHFSAFGSLDYHTAAFFLEGLKGNDRLMFQQRRAEVGMKWSPREQVGLTAAVGYSWAEEFSIGFDSRTTTELADFSDEPYFRLGFQMKF